MSQQATFIALSIDSDYEIGSGANDQGSLFASCWELKVN